MHKVSDWKNRWDKNYINGYANKLSNAPAEDEPMHWYFSKYLFPTWRDVTKDDTVLELGVGNGAVAVRVFKKVKKFIGTDISKVAIDMAKERFKAHKNVELKRTTNLLSVKEPIDMIYSVTVFQHLPKEFTKKYIEDSYTILKDDGVMFFNVLSGVQNKNEADITFEENGVCEPSMGFSKDEIEKICKDAGFSSVEIIRMEVYVPTTAYWWLWVLCKKGKM